MVIINQIKIFNMELNWRHQIKKFIKEDWIINEKNN